MKKRHIIFLLMIVIALLGIILSVTYALNANVTENTTSDYDLSYTFDISDNTTWNISVEAGKTKVYEITLTNPYNDLIKYGVVYKMNTPETLPEGSMVAMLSDSENSSTGSINANATINVSIAIVNGSTSNMQVTISIVNGYKNGGDLIIPEGYTLITDEYGIGVPSAKKTLIQLGLTEAEGTPDFSKTSCSDGCGESTVGIYKTKDDFGTSYYFRGDVENNYVYFANKYWRIIRINGDGSVRMIYAGTSAHPNGYDDSSTTDMRIGISAFNSSYNDNAYVGYMYGTTGSSTYSLTHSNTNNSTIKTTIDNWYNTNIKNTEYEQYVVDTIYCNDREVSTVDSSYTGDGTSTNQSAYKARERLFTNKTPTLKCNQVNDRFTKRATLYGIEGNGKLENPIGLITADEVAYAGGGTGNSKYYLYIGTYYWTMSPSYFGGSSAGGFGVSSAGALGYNFGVDNGFLGVRPVISISSDNLEGSGTMNNPFHITTKNQTLSSKQVLTKLGLTENTGTPDFSKTSCSSGCNETTVGVFKTQDDIGDSYYFRGDVENNYVYFAGFYWRIIRINGDGSVRMIYAGTSAHENGYDDSDTLDMRIGASAFNDSYNRNAYVGYMYGSTAAGNTYEETHANTKNSTVKTVVDTWYESNIKGTTNEQYIVDTIYCNDRGLSSGTGRGGSETYYNAYERLSTNKIPTLKCNQVNDRFTVNSLIEKVEGNGALTYSIGLITADEVAYAGGVSTTKNSKYYLYTSKGYWTMSPYWYSSDSSIAYEFNVYATGDLSISHINGNGATGGSVRPVISISPNNLIGSGTMSDPFHITTENQTLSSKQVLTKLGLTENTGTPDFSKTSCSSGCNETTVGVFKTQDDIGDSYYFRGDVTNNYVYFAGFYWRIIRINGDGSIRMIYAGTSAHSNGYDDSSANDTSIENNTFNSSNNDNAYVGYMYGATGASTYDATHSNINDSTIKVVLDGWYNTNIKGTANEQYVVDTIYCNDREVSSGTGIGTTDTDYKLKARIEVNNNITLKCSQVNDRFTVNSKVSGVTGNGALTNPIGLITADEIAYAGGSFDLNNSKYYLYNKNFFWTMSPVGLFDGSSYGFIVNSRGALVDSPMFLDGYVDAYDGVRPVISISPNNLIGSGSMSDPFKIG